MSIRVGVIGVGVVGRGRSKKFASEVKGAELTAVCDIDPVALDWAKNEFGDAVKRYDEAEKMWADVDAVMIATPHPSHPELAIRAFEQGKHVLIEKPAGVDPKHVREMNEAAKAADKVFAVHFQHRYKPINQLIRDLVQSGELGRIHRINWIITTWFRSQHYYNTGGWRATWEGEGGGVLLNQAPHQLDLWQWFFGMPERLRAFCYNGKFHDMETEDEATLFMEYADGCTGVFITSTAENPGTNRLEITADRGRLIAEDGKLFYKRTKDPVTESIKTSKNAAWGGPSWNVDLEIGDGNGVGPAQEFIDAIVKGSDLVVPGESGLNEVLLASAALQSSWTDDWVSIAEFDEENYLSQLNERIQNSSYVKPDLAKPNYDENY